MSFSKISAISGALALASTVAAHGIVTGIVADGVYYEGYDPNFQYRSIQPTVVGWSIPQDQDRGFVAVDAYTSPDIICHKGATNAKTSATVRAGKTVDLEWSTWPESHSGPVIDYLASCNGDCTTVDKTTLEFFKIDGIGLLDATPVPGRWATDTLIAHNNTWIVTIPSDIAPGNYVLRHEIIALHNAYLEEGAQNYPQCFNLKVTGSGTATPSGTLGTALYTPPEAGISINIFNRLASYVVPGPTLYSGAASASATSTTAVALTSSSVATSFVSSPTSVITSSATLKSSGAAPYSNYTATASKSKSACKSKATSVALISSVAPQGQVLTSTASETESFAATVKIPTSSSAPTASSGPSGTSGPYGSDNNSGPETSSETTPSTTASKSAPLDSSSHDITMPEGTTLSNLLSWVASFYSTHKDTEYTGSTIARRAHARDVVRREEMEKFDGVRAAASGTHGGFPHGTGHPHHHHYSGSPKPTGVFGRQEMPHGTGAPYPYRTGAPSPHGTGAPHHGHHGHHDHGTGVAGGAPPTGVFPGFAFPTGSGKFRTFAQ